MNDELLALAERIVNTPHSWLPTEGCVKNITFNATECSILHDALRLAAQSPEPVAWRWRFEDQSAWTVSKKRPLHADDRDVICEPLYTAPPQSAPVAVKPLEWVERDGVTGTFDASTSIGHYIATVTDDNRGYWFIVGMTTGNYTDPDIERVKAAAQADYEQRIRSALVNAPAVDGALREALKDLEAWCDNQGALLGAVDGYDYRSGQEAAYRHTAIEIGKRIKSLAASEATKSDGGVERRHAVDDGGATRPTGDAKAVREAGVAPGPSDLDARLERLQDEATDLGYVLTPEPEHPDSPHASDTRPADVTATPRVTDNDRDEIVVTRDGKELRGWSYSTEQERRVKMLCAREFVEGFHAGRQP